eukprot:scaffold1453_cov112-Isochrysis_galbana.AAC.17
MTSHHQAPARQSLSFTVERVHFTTERVQARPAMSGVSNEWMMAATPCGAEAVSKGPFFLMYYLAVKCRWALLRLVAGLRGVRLFAACTLCCCGFVDVDVAAWLGFGEEMRVGAGTNSNIATDSLNFNSTPTRTSDCDCNSGIRP